MFNPKASPSKRQHAVQGLIAELNSNGAPILLGPWRSELGFEVSYWTPFLRFLAGKVKKFADRAAVVTRGGLGPLYRDVAASGFDLYALRSVPDVRRENLYDAKVRQAGKTIKQLQITEWDEAVLQDAAHELGIKGLYHTVHPAWMYWALAPYWEEACGLKYLSSLTDYAPLPKLAVAGGLPPSYVAVKFYGRATFPYPHPEIASFVQHTVATIAAQSPVVMLTGGPGHDDHTDIPVAGENILTLPNDMPPEQNLAAQAAVISHAKAFVGTYGGIAQLALRMGVPSYSFYAEFGGTAHAHLSLSSWISKATNVPFVVNGLRDIGFVRQVLSVPAQNVASGDMWQRSAAQELKDRPKFPVLSVPQRVTA